MSLPADYFHDVFEGSDDPWSLRSRWYEQRKRAVTLAALPRERFTRAFEPGCANGELTHDLAQRCESMIASDTAPRAVALASQRLEAERHVEFLRQSVPAEWPDGRFDLVVVSEMAYYFDRVDLRRLVERIEASLTNDGIVLMCHWRHPVADYPLGGDEAHEAFAAATSLTRTVSHVEEDFVLEVWNVDARSVATREGMT